MATFTNLENALEPASRSARGGASGTALHTRSHLGGRRPVEGAQVIGRHRLEGLFGLSDLATRARRAARQDRPRAGTHRLARRPWPEQVAGPGAPVPPHAEGGAGLSLLRSPGSGTMCYCDVAQVDRGP